jgi:hypothetical protein
MNHTATHTLSIRRRDGLRVWTNNSTGAVEANAAVIAALEQSLLNSCTPVSENKWETEYGMCYGNDGNTPPPLATDVLYEPNTGVPMNAGNGSTGATDTYLHNVLAVYQGSNILEVNADDATTPYDGSTHGGVIMTNTVTAQTAVNVAVAAIEAAAGVPAGTYKATYFLTTALPQQVVLVYNAALAAEVANGTYIAFYVGSTQTPNAYQEKPDMNTPSSLTAADLSTGKFRVEVRKLVSPDGGILQRRVFDDRTEPPSEITPFDPLLIGGCTPKVDPVIPQSSSRKICAMMDLAGTPTKVNILEVSTPQADGTTVTTYLDPHVSPMVDVTAQFISFENDGKCPCTINGTIPAVDVLSGSLGIIAGATRAATPAFTGAPATATTAGIAGKLQSFTVTASGVTDGVVSADSVTVTLPSGVPLKLFDGQAFTWAVARNQDDEVLKPISVTATGNAYANIGYTTV